MAMVSAAAIPLAAEGRKKGAVTTEDMDTWGAYTAAEDPYDGRGYYGPRYYGGGFGLGFYATPGYGYVAPVCNPPGFYDQGGYWHYYRGCAASPYGY